MKTRSIKTSSLWVDSGSTPPRITRSCIPQGTGVCHYYRPCRHEAVATWGVISTSGWTRSTRGRAVGLVTRDKQDTTGDPVSLDHRRVSLVEIHLLPRDDDPHRRCESQWPTRSDGPKVTVNCFGVTSRATRPALPVERSWMDGERPVP
jgi:hypothetical protein